MPSRRKYPTYLGITAFDSREMKSRSRNKILFLLNTTSFVQICVSIYPRENDILPTVNWKCSAKNFNALLHTWNEPAHNQPQCNLSDIDLASPLLLPKISRENSRHHLQRVLWKHFNVNYQFGRACCNMRAVQSVSQKLPAIARTPWGSQPSSWQSDMPTCYFLSDSNNNNLASKQRIDALLLPPGMR